MSVKAKARKTVEKRKQRKVSLPKQQEKANKLKVMSDTDAEAYITSLSKDEIKLLGAEAKILSKAQEATANLNQVIREIERLQTVRLQLIGERAGHLNTLIELEDERRAGSSSK
jgi:hypothetical protein